jgi:hypothetical protein
MMAKTEEWRDRIIKMKQYEIKINPPMFDGSGGGVGSPENE